MILTSERVEGTKLNQRANQSTESELTFSEASLLVQT